MYSKRNWFYSHSHNADECYLVNNLNSVTVGLGSWIPVSVLLHSFMFEMVNRFIFWIFNFSKI
jgi:hypothetical protein